MINYIRQHIKLVLGISVFIILGTILLLTFLNKDTVDKNINNPGSGITKSGYLEDNKTSYLEDSSIPDTNKYLMLLGQEAVQNYGTNKFGDFLDLQNLLNQSTDNYKVVVQSKIDTLDSKKKIITTVDPDSIQLRYTSGGNGVEVSLNAESVDERGVKKSFKAVVTLIKDGEYWLVDDIVTE